MMKVFLRNKQTRLYCDNRSEWGVSITQALVFSSVPQAARYAYHQELPEAEIVLKSDFAEQEVALPLLPGWCDLP